MKAINMEDIIFYKIEYDLKDHKTSYKAYLAKFYLASTDFDKEWTSTNQNLNGDFKHLKYGAFSDIDFYVLCLLQLLRKIIFKLKTKNSAQKNVFTLYHLTFYWVMGKHKVGLFLDI